MTQPISTRSIDPTLKPQWLPSATPARTADGADFKSMLLQSLHEVNQLQQEAHGQVQQMLTGQTDNLAEVMTAVKKAQVAFDLLMEIRNKMIDAYQELRQMQV
jgi:flagellar hook-basal body complex protein FliE